jgi:hypothetical protein
MKTLVLRVCFTAFPHTVRLQRRRGTKEAGASQLTKAYLQGAEALNLGDLRPEPSNGQDDHGVKDANGASL